MTISIEIPASSETVLRAAFGENLSRAALEAIAVDGYRSGKLSRYEVQTLLGFADRWETESWFASKGVQLNYGVEDLEADRLTLAAKFSEHV